MGISKELKRKVIAEQKESQKQQKFLEKELKKREYSEKLWVRARKKIGKDTWYKRLGITHKEYTRKPDGFRRFFLSKHQEIKGRKAWTCEGCKTNCIDSQSKLQMHHDGLDGHGGECSYDNIYQVLSCCAPLCLSCHKHIGNLHDSKINREGFNDYIFTYRVIRKLWAYLYSENIKKRKYTDFKTYGSFIRGEV